MPFAEVRYSRRSAALEAANSGLTDLVACADLRPQDGKHAHVTKSLLITCPNSTLHLMHFAGPHCDFMVQMTDHNDACHAIRSSLAETCC